MAFRDVLVAMVAYNNTQALERAFDALGDTLDVLVVDNGADPAVRALVDDRGAEYVAPGRNIGFAAAVNIALGTRRERDVLLLNPDARISAESVGALSAALHEGPTICAVAPRLVHPSGAAQRVEWPIPSPRQEWVNALRLHRFFPPRRRFLAGAVLLLRHDAIGDVGPFDERFFLYAEESDWQLRAALRGWEVRVVEHVTAEHRGGGSSEVERARVRHSQDSARLFALKWYGMSGWASMRAASLLGHAARLLLTLPWPERRARYGHRLRS